MEETMLDKLKEELKQIKIQIITTHKKTSRIIHGRMDISQPLNFQEAEDFSKLNKDCENLFDRVAIIEEKIKKIKGEKEREKLEVKKPLTLTVAEFDLLKMFYQNRHAYLKMTEVQKLGNIERNRAYERVRILLAKNLVSAYTTEKGQGAYAKGYTITLEGIDLLTAK